VLKVLSRKQRPALPMLTSGVNLHASIKRSLQKCVLNWGYSWTRRNLALLHITTFAFAFPSFHLIAVITWVTNVSVIIQGKSQRFYPPADHRESHANMILY
jgi:hypothetical protein